MPVAAAATMMPVRAYWPKSGHVEVWSTRLDAAAASHGEALLSDEERARAARFVFERDRMRFVAAHGALRSILARYLDAGPCDLVFVLGRENKPILIDVPLAFSLSHSEDIALIAVASHGEIGVDVEVVREMRDAHALAQRHFNPTECTQLANVDSDDYDRAFLAGWTRKEAVLKAIGAGLTLDTRGFEVGLPRIPMRISVIDRGLSVSVHLCDVDVGIRACAAVASTLPIECVYVFRDGAW